MPITLPVSYTTTSLMIMTEPAINSISNVTSELMHHHAGMAESQMNAKLTQNYTIPFTNEIPILQTISTDLAIYQILSSRVTLRTGDKESPWYERFKSAVELLDQLADGSLKMVTSSGDIVNGRSDIAEMTSTNKDYKSTFYEGGDWSEQVIDPDKIDANFDDRNL